MSRHAWEKLAEHSYRCTRCGMDKRNLPPAADDGPRQWSVLFERAGQRWQGATPPCPGELPWPDLPAESSGWCKSQWNAWVEAGTSIQERRARLLQCPEIWRDSVRAHCATVYALRDAARLRAKAKQQRRDRW